MTIKMVSVNNFKMITTRTPRTLSMWLTYLTFFVNDIRFSRKAGMLLKLDNAHLALMCSNG